MSSVELWVEAFDADKDLWNKYGTPPYLDAQDGTSYVEDNDRNNDCGYFTFASSSDLGTINSVYLYMYAWGAATNDFEAEINDTGTDLGPPTSAGWVNIEVTPIISTWAEVNSATLMLDRRSTTNVAGCDAAYLLVNYTESAGPTPDAFNKLAYVSEPPTVGAWNKLAYDAGDPTPGTWNKLKYGG